METKVVELSLNDVLPNRFQPRIKFSEESIQELANSIKEHGVIQPIVVRNLGDKYEIIAGERRYKASVMAGKQTVPAIITDLNEKDSAEVALIENVQRKDLTPIEEAISYKKILDMGYLTQEELATKLGKTQSTIANKLRLLNLDDNVQEALLNEQISERHARSLLKITSHLNQKQMLDRIIDERLTVRKADEEIDKMMNNNLNNEVPNNQTNDQLEVFNPSIENLNIPTSSIINDIEPVENLNFNQPQNTVEPSNTFNSISEVIPSTIPPVSFDNIETTTNDVPVETEYLNFGQSLNIPNIPIEEPIISNPPVEEKINPGFMDISKIEKEATDIFVPKETPVENLLETPSVNLQPSIEKEANLLNQTELMYPNNTNIEESDDEENAEDILVPGKFFNLMPEEEPKEQLVQTKADSNINDAFNFNLDINSLNNIESTNNLPPLEELNLSQAASPFTIDQIKVDTPQSETFNINPTIELETKPVENINPPLEEKATPIFNFTNFETPIQEAKPENLFVPTQEAKQDEYNSNEIKNAETNQFNYQPVESLNNDFTIPNNYAQQSAEIEELNFNNPISNTMLESQNDMEFSYNTMPEILTNIESKSAVPSNGTELKTAINMIRDLNDTLSRIGYVIDTEEFDFENMYQVIFKINKK